MHGLNFNISKIKKIVNIAKTIAMLSKDEQTKVGALLLSYPDLAIIATGYNGFIRNALDDILPKKRPEKYKYIIHAELNLILNCARHGIKTEGHILICTHSPCQSCLRHIINCGIKMVFFEKWYTPQSELEDKDLNISVKKIDNDLFSLSFNNF